MFQISVLTAGTVNNLFVFSVIIIIIVILILIALLLLS